MSSGKRAASGEAVGHAAKRARIAGFVVVKIRHADSPKRGPVKIVSSAIFEKVLEATAWIDREERDLVENHVADHPAKYARYIRRDQPGEDVLFDDAQIDKDFALLLADALRGDYIEQRYTFHLHYAD
jgi:hypothetical protein